jgi:hypothetical protein
VAARRWREEFGLEALVAREPAERFAAAQVHLMVVSCLSVLVVQVSGWFPHNVNGHGLRLRDLNSDH